MLTEEPQVQVTVPLTAMVSIAGLRVPFWSLWKKMSLRVTDAVAGGGDPVPPPLVPPPFPPPLLGPVGLLLSLQPASRSVASMPLASRIIT